MNAQNITRKRTWRGWSGIAIATIFFVSMLANTIPGSITGDPFSGFADASDTPMVWNPSTLPSALSYTMEETFPGLTGDDEVDVSTSLPVTATNIAVDNLTVNPISTVIEAVPMNYSASDAIYGILLFQQLKVPASCYVQWVSIFIEYLRIGDLTPLSLNVSIYNATQVFPSLAPTPHEMVAGSSVMVDPRLGTSGSEVYLGHWKNVTLGNVLLDSSNTLYQGGYYHFFVGVLLPAETGYLWWYSGDNDGFAEDNGLVYASITTATLPAIRIATEEVPGVDFTCITKLFPLNMAPLPSFPSDIGMKVDGDLVADNGAGKGIYSSNDPRVPTNNLVTYDITSAWSDYPGGSMSYDLELNYTVQTDITPVLLNAINTTTRTVFWNATYTFIPSQIQGRSTANLGARVPNSWTSVALYNITGGTMVPKTALVAPGPTGKYRQLTATGLTPGTWLLTARSPVLTPSITLNLVDGAVDLNSSLTGTIQATGGPNGRQANLRSDYEGGISSITTQGGTASSTLPGTVLWTDGKWFTISNETGLDLVHIAEKLNAYEFTETSSINSTFDLFLDLPEGFSETNLLDLKFLLDQESFSDSWWWANITGVAMPENPFAPPSLSEVFSILLQADLNYTMLNFSFNITENRFSDAYMNYSLNVFDQLAVNRSAITGITFDVVSSFNASYSNQVFYIKNQSSPSTQWVQLYNTIQLPTIPVLCHKRWNSIGESGITNITQFISSIDNTIELRVRNYNLTYVVPTGSHYFAVDQAAINFTYANTFESLDLQVYNWTDSTYAAPVAHFSPGTTNASIDLQPLFPSGFAGIIDPTTGKIRVRIGAEALLPLVNTVWWRLDRLLANISYTNYVRCSWNQIVLNDASEPSYSFIHETLFDSPNNNFTISLPVADIIDFCDDYNYTILWHNGSDVMYARSPFSINRHATTLSIISGIEGEYKMAGSDIQVAVKLAYSGNGSGIPNRPVQVVLVIKLDTGASQTVTVNGLTNSQGIANVGIRFLSEWQSFTYSAVFASSDPAFKDSGWASTADIMVYTEIEVIGWAFTEYWYIIVPAIALILVGVIAKRTGDAKKKRIWKADASKIRDVVKIQHLMVIMKSSGACVVNRAYSQMQLDGDLISGFLHAIATFGKEVGGDRGAPKKTSGEGIVFDYQDFKILIQEGSQVRLALILNGPPTDGLKDRAKQFITAFEGSYDMQNWRGNLDIFSGIDSFIEQAFEITLIYPLVVNPKMDKKDIKTGLGKALYEVGEAVQKEKQAFYLATLLTFAQAGRKESQDQVLGEIYQLKKQGFLTFYNPPATQGA